MTQYGLKILIVEDDASLGDVLKEALTRKGHFPFHVLKPDEALQLLMRQNFDLMLIDCLLPNMTGTELVKKIKAEPNFSNLTKIVLMSGIYTDKTFQQESLQETGASGFLKKPFKIEELDIFLSSIKPKKVETNEQPRKKLYETFEKEKVSPREKRKLIESLEEVDGYDLPFIYSLLSETKSSGHLNIFNSTGEVSGVSFSQGHIVGVDVEDQSTVLGHMLIQSGYILPEDLQEILQDKSPRKIGQKLIDSCKLSPHAFDLILGEQMNVRLTRTIVDGQVKVNFVATEVENVPAAIDSEQLLIYLHDWVASKLPISWLESLYLMWSGQKILTTAAWKSDHPVMKTSFVKRLSQFPQKIEAGVSLTELLSLDGYDSVSVHKALHLMLLKGVIIFSAEKMVLDSVAQRKHLKKIQSQLQDKDSSEVLELFQELLKDKPDTIWLDEFIGFVGPAPEDPEVLKIWKNVKDRFEKAIRIHWDQSSQEITKIRKNEKSQQRLASMQKLDEVKALLQLNQFSKASDLIKAIKNINDVPGGRLYKAWIQIGTMTAARKSVEMKEVELELMQIPPDERYDSFYLYVMGLYLKAKGDLSGAKKAFEKSVAINPTFIVAKREITMLDSLVNQPKQDIFNMDLKDVVAGFFKKKAG